MSRSGRGLGALLVLSLAAAACEVAPSPSASVVETPVPFVSTSYPEDAPADCAYGGEIAQIRAVDRLTVEFSLCYADPAFLTKLALANNAIQDGDWLARYAPDDGLRTHANGTGPYSVTDGAPGAGTQITLGRYDGYWGELATAATVSVRWNAYPAARLRALQDGTADGIDSPSQDRFAAIEGDSTLQLRLREALSTMYIGMSNTYQPFDSVPIRRALAQGIDRQAILDRVFPPGSSLAQYFTPCSIGFACEGDPWYDQDTAAARAVLARPGFAGPLTVHVYYPDEAACGLADPGLVAAELQAQLVDDLGIAADLRPQAAAEFQENLAAGLLDGLYVAEWCPDLPDVTRFLGDPFTNRANPQFGTIDASISGPLAAAARTADPEARRAAYADANDAIRDLVPVIPLAHGGSATAWRADVAGAISSPFDAEQFAGMDPGGRPTLVWMQSASPSTFHCADATDGDSRRICQNIFEGLYGFKPGTAEVMTGLAESCAPSQDLTLWTCHLQSGVTFHDGAALDANDVVVSLAAQWDYEQPMHAGHAGAFAMWVDEFGPFLNAPPATP